MISQIVTTIKSAVPTVATTKASMQDWQATQTAVGSARAFNGADLAAEVGGVVDEIDFESGQTVAAGTCCCGCGRTTTTRSWQQLQANADLAAVTLLRDQRQFAGARRRSGHGRHRRGQSQGGACPGHGAAGGDGGEDDPRPVRRAARGAAGGSRAVHRGGNHDRDPATARSDVRGFLSAAAGTRADRRRSEGRGDRRRLSRTRLSPGRCPR